MILLENAKPMRIYRGGGRAFLPTLQNDKKKGSAITLLSPNYEASKSLMNHPMMVNNLRFQSYYIEKSLAIIINDKNIQDVEEAAILEMKRSELPDSAFGIPESRKFPLDTEQHVKSAIKLFGHCDEDKKKELAKRIASKAKKYGIKIPETTQVYKYLHEALNDIIDDNVILEKGEFIIHT